MKVLTKLALIDSVHQRINGAITKFMLTDALNVICQYISENLEENRSVSITNFGTFSIHTFPPHKGFNVNTGELQITAPTNLVKFRPHQKFAEVVQERYHYFTTLDNPQKNA